MLEKRCTSLSNAHFARNNFIISRSNHCKCEVDTSSPVYASSS